MKRLKNSEYVYAKGRELRLAAEAQAKQSGSPVGKPPFFSHDATLQCYFERGWLSITHCDIALHLDSREVLSGGDLIAQIRRFKQCHFQSQPSQR
ncbi:hypothetical protein MRM63_15495 [bacterium 19MO03SA05]|uniref:Transposase n=1 Tax=bacterium 19MO03SA05 TaxID=2920620 RepID=A0AAU6VM56_UNCXX